MSKILDPGKDARRQARAAEEDIRRQKQLESNRLAESKDEEARAKYVTGGGRRSLISTSRSGASLGSSNV